MRTEHEILTPNTEAPYHLLSLQHWRQKSKYPDGTNCIINHDKMIKNGMGHNDKTGINITNCNEHINPKREQLACYRRLKRIIDDQEAESVTPFNFEYSAEELNTFSQNHPEDNKQKENGYGI